jgi:hypothetical protein
MHLARVVNSRVIIFADLNSVPTTSSVRGIARDAGHSFVIEPELELFRRFESFLATLEDHTDVR